MNFRHFEEKVRRGIGFDKPELDPDDPNTCGCASDKVLVTMGLRFSCWVDPETEIIYVFLSNRTFPDENNNLFRVQHWTEIQKLVHEALIK